MAELDLLCVHVLIEVDVIPRGGYAKEQVP